MPLLRPMTHSGLQYKVETLTKSNCAGCPDAWFTVNFDTEFNGGTQGSYVRDKKDNYYWTDAPLAELIYVFGWENVFEVGRDGYYLSMPQHRLAINDGVHGVHLVDDFNDEFQDYFVCKDDDDHTPYIEAHVAEPIR